ncbi:MAG: FAD-dependent oxidoreductase [Anaerolineae bacterium]
MAAEREVVGAVMVVGGGIAGIQASLDLAEAGFKVYLVEAKSAIGGHMAQLDKTFPTNDCAMCNLSPKLVEAGRHRNIEILTDTEVIGLTGEAGNFTARLRRKPRYIDLDKCIGCGDCAQVCPVTVPNQYEEGLVQHKAVYRLYPQAIPNAFAIEKRGVAPCRDACPAGQRAQGYISLIRAGRYEDALRVIKEDNPFPSVCGRTCHHPCEGRCNRAPVDGAVNIMALKRFVADYVYAREHKKPQPVPQTRPQRVAVVGSGPAGLTAAQDLVKLGYGVTVFEALPVAGGMMRVGIPEHRLPKEVLQRDIDDILALGVELKLNSPISDPTELLAEGYDAVYLATGVTRRTRLGIEGETLAGVISAIALLRRVNLGQPVEIGERVAVVGGGITAVDAATTALRLGAREVHLVYRRSKGEIPAYQWEMDEAESEGVQILQNCIATRILGQEGKVVGLECVRVQRGQEGYRPLPGSEFTLDVDTVIRAVGQFSDLSFFHPRFEEFLGHPETLATSIPGIFASSGAQPGAGFIINAVALGHRAAASIDRYLRGEPLQEPQKPALPVAKWNKQETLERMEAEGIERRARIEPALLPVEERVGSFKEVVLGLTEEQARAEAERCLQCGLCSECLECVYACQAGAIVHDMVELIEEINVGAVILAPGYQAYRAELSQEYGFGRYPNVVTSLQFERLLSASGPTGGHIQRPSDGKRPRKIAFLQCIGSRDQNHDYCSAVCCMYATKEAIMAKEHEPDTDVHVFMMDMRAFSKGYEEYYRRARGQYGIEYVRCRVSAVKENPKSHNLIVRYVREQGAPITEEEFDLVVLSVGMEISDSVRKLARDLGIELDDYGFCHTVRFDPVQTSRPGIYAIGPFTEPKDIPETVVDASGAAAQAGGLLAASRGTLSRRAEYPPERDVAGEAPRIGVFVCHCGNNIGGFLDVPAVAEYARSLPGVVHAEDLLYACSQDSIAAIIERVRELGLNRVVVASCSPRLLGPTFQEAIRQAGLNPYLFEMANIRNQCSWVHSHDWEGATRKAKELVRMSVARAVWLQPLYHVELPLKQAALVIGGGVAGMSAALSLAQQGFPVHLVEKEAELGGNLRHIYYTLDGADPQALLRSLVSRVEENELIHVYRGAEVREVSGHVGNFTVTVESIPVSLSTDFTLDVGVIIVATGGREYRGPEYGYGSDPRIVTQQEFEALLAEKSTGRRGDGSTSETVASELIDPLLVDSLPVNSLPSDVVMIQCVGPADRYCGRICCTTALKNALKIKELSPSTQVTILYKDIRVYGFKERYYTRAREKGVLFIRYDDEHLPRVQADERLEVRVWEPVLGEEITLQPDLLVLSMPIVPAEGARELGSLLKVPVDLDGFFMEAHIKLRPVDFASDGIFMAGLAHYPKLLEETMVQAQAAAARAATILSRPTLRAGGVVAVVDPAKCTACLTCLRICPYEVPRIATEVRGAGGILGAAHIEAATCQGCGICAAECPARAIQLMHYTDVQVTAQVDALLGAAIPAQAIS